MSDPNPPINTDENGIITIKIVGNTGNGKVWDDQRSQLIPADILSSLHFLESCLGP